MTDTTRSRTSFFFVAFGLLLAVLTVTLGMTALVHAQTTFGETGAPDSGNSSLNASPGTLRADGSSTAALTARVRDSANDPIPGSFVGFTATKGTTNYPFAEAESDSVQKSGVWTEESADGASGGTVIAANGVLNPVVAPVASWDFSGESINLRYRRGPDGGKARVEIDAGMVFTVDTYADPADWQDFTQTGLGTGPHTISVTATTDKNASSTGFMVRLDSFQAGATTAADGNASAVLTSIDLASGSETSTVYATMVGSKIVETTTVVMEASRPATMSLTADDDAISVGGGTTTTLRAAVDDQFNQGVRDGSIVTFTTDMGNVGSSTVTKTTSGGEATASLSAGTTAGTATITATARGAVVDTTMVDFTPGPPATVTLAADPSSVACLAASMLTADAVDEFGNDVSDGTAVSFSADLAGAFAANPASTTNGTATTSFTPTGAGSGTITATAGSASGSTGITVTPGPPDDIDLTRSEENIGISSGPGPTSSLITTTVQDACASPVSAGTTVTFTTSLGDIGSSTTTKTTDASGVATATLTAGDVPGRADITATAGSAVETTFVDIAGGPAQVNVSVSPTSVQVGGNNAAVTASVQDAFDNPVVDGTTVTFTVAAGNTISPTVGATENGQATATFTSGTEAGPTPITAAVDSLAGTEVVTLTPGPLDDFDISSVPEPQTVGQPFTIEITAKDAFENVKTDYAGPAALADTTGSIDPTSTGTFTDGVWQGEVTIFDADTTQIMVSDGAVEGSSNFFRVEPADSAIVLVDANPSSIPVGGATSTITAIVKDRRGNDAPDGTVVTFTTTSGTFPGGVDTTTRQTSNGQATVDLASGTADETATVQAESDGIFDEVTVRFTPGPPDQVALMASPTTIFIGGGGSTLTATVMDEFGNAVEDGTEVTFDTTLGAFPRGATTTTATTTGGVAISLLEAGAVPGTATVGATANSASAEVAVFVRARVFLPITNRNAGGP